MKLENVFADKNAAPAPVKRASVVVDPNPRKERVFLDADGNEINPRTKQIISINEG
jgi:hypothetical protein